MDQNICLHLLHPQHRVLLQKSVFTHGNQRHTKIEDVTIINLKKCSMLSPRFLRNKTVLGLWQRWKEKSLQQRWQQRLRILKTDFFSFGQLALCVLILNQSLNYSLLTGFKLWPLMYQDQYMLDVLVVRACLMPSWSVNCVAKMLDF